MTNPPKRWPAVIKQCLIAGAAWPDLGIPADDPKWADLLGDLRNDRRAQAKLLATVPPVIVARAISNYLTSPQGSLPAAWLEALAPCQDDPGVHPALAAGFIGAMRRIEQEPVPPSRGAWPAVLAQMSGPPGWANRLVEDAMRRQLVGLRTEFEPYLDASAETVNHNMLREAVRTGVAHLAATDPDSLWPWFQAHCPPEARAGALLHALAEENGWGVGLLEANEALPVPLAAVVASFSVERFQVQFLDGLNAALTRTWVPASLVERVYQAGRANPEWLPVFADRYRAEAREQTLHDRPAAPARPRRRP